MYLRKVSLEFVACRLSLKRNWQGYLTSFSTSLVRCNSTKPNHHLFRDVYNLPKGGTVHVFRILRSHHTTGNMEDLYVEHVVCKEGDLEDNEMKVVELGSDEYKVLLVKQGGKFYATGTKCTHYGAPLVKGHLGHLRVRCPWHGACFNLKNGDIEDFPGLDSIPCYEVKHSDGNVIVRARKDLLETNRRVKTFVQTVQPKKTFIVVGGGPAGTICAETLRAEGFDGRIIFVIGEEHLPYDRVKLSKSLDVDVSRILLRPLDFYMERNIEIMKNTKLIELNPARKEACLDNGTTLTFDKIFLATGDRSASLDLPGAELQNIFGLRTAEDANLIKEAISKAGNVVIVGVSFIAMEVAAYCAGKVKSVVVVGRDVPFKKLFGQEIGNRIVKLYEEKKVKFHLGHSIKRFVGINEVLKSIELSGGLTLPADVCVLGVGSLPNTNYLVRSGITFHKSGGIEVNEFLQTCESNVYAGGDIAVAPVLGRKARIGHWGLASYHGLIAAHNMVGKKTPLKSVPFFWTMLLGKAFRYAGFTEPFDDVVIHGSVEDLEFIAFHCTGDRVNAVTTLNRDPLAAKFAEMLYEGRKLKKSDIPSWLKG